MKDFHFKPVMQFEIWYREREEFDELGIDIFKDDESLAIDLEKLKKYMKVDLTHHVGWNEEKET